MPALMAALLGLFLSAHPTSSLQQQATRDRQVLAGWLRGTHACQAGRVARHLAEMLRGRGLRAEFHAAGRDGGYTLAEQGPLGAPLLALFVVDLAACPEPPNEHDLQWQASARDLWQAAALSAAISRSGWPELRHMRIAALFVAGADAKTCGRALALDTLPTLAEAAWIVELGGGEVIEGDPRVLVLHSAYPRQVELVLNADPQQADPGAWIDRLQAVAESRSFVLPDKLSHPALALLPQAGSLQAHCKALPRLSPHKGRLRCWLPARCTTQDLAFALYKAAHKPPVVIRYDSAEEPHLASDARRSWIADLARPVWSRVIVRSSTAPTSPCAGLDPSMGPSTGLPLFSARELQRADAQAFARGVVFTDRVLRATAELAQSTSAQSTSAGADR